MQDPSFVSLVRNVKSAIVEVQRDLAAEQLTITACELALKVAVKKEGTVGAKFKLVVVDVDLGATINQLDVKTITLTLVPRVRRGEAARGLGDDLSQAIRVIGEAVREAAAAPPLFDLEQATIEFNFASTEEGKIILFAVAGGGGSGSSEQMHTIKLTLRP